MARVKGRGGSGRDDVAIKLDRTLVTKARLIAAHKGMSVAELCSTLLRGPLDKAYAQLIRDLEGESR